MTEAEELLEARIKFLLNVGDLANKEEKLSTPVTVQYFRGELSFLDPFVDNGYLKVLGAGYNPKDETKKEVHCQLLPRGERAYERLKDQYDALLHQGRKLFRRF